MDLRQVKHAPYDELAAKVERVRQWLHDLVAIDATDFYYPHLSVHEIEAWFLAEGQSIKTRLGPKAQLNPRPDAESLNFDRPPARRLHELYHKHGREPGYERQKVIESTALLKNLKFSTVQKNCAHFRRFYEDLCAVGRKNLSR